MRRRLVLVVVLLVLAGCMPPVPSYIDPFSGSGIRQLGQSDIQELRALRKNRISLVLSQNTKNSFEFRKKLIQSFNNPLNNAVSSKESMANLDSVLDPKAVANSSVLLLRKYFDQGIELKPSLEVAARENPDGLIVLMDRQDGNGATFSGMNISAKSGISFIDPGQGQEFFRVTAEATMFCENPGPSGMRQKFAECFLLVNKRVSDELDRQLESALGSVRPVSGATR